MGRELLNILNLSALSAVIISSDAQSARAIWPSIFARNVDLKGHKVGELYR